MTLKKLLSNISLLLLSTFGFSQNFNVQELGKAKLVNVSGGASANTVFYSGNASREPFSYFLNGNININIAGLYNLPFSFSYTNQKLGYGKPVLMNRLSIHPSYKWITGHIGDVSMTFSPYTLSGHQFSGVGVDLTPQGNFKISAMYGRLLKSSEYNSLYPEIVPTYKRIGYGFKTSYAFEKINLGVTFFKAKDEAGSLSTPFPFELGIAPKDNAAVSIESSFKVLKKLQIFTEYANSSITEDLRAGGNARGNSLSSFLLNKNSTTNSYDAFKGQLTYPAGKGTLGLGYERIDPNYRTLGGYYFNNDLENITVNATQNIVKDKVSLALNLGLQKDNLDKQKQSQMKRVVSSVTADFRPNDKLNLNVNYSNFQSYTNSRNQFDYINQVSDYDYLDTLNFRQVNQNAAININYLLKNDKHLKKTISANFSMQDAVNQQQGRTIEGGASTYYNSGIAYTVGYPEKDLNFTGSLNNTYGKTDTGKNLIIGPTIGASKLFFDKKLTTNASTSYNTSYNDGTKQNEIINFRLNGSYIYLQNHNFNMNVIALFSNSSTQKNNDLTATLAYTYSFDKIKMRPKRDPLPENETKTVSEPILKINFKNQIFEGTQDQIIAQLKETQITLHPLPNAEKDNLEHLITLASLTPDDKELKEKVLDYLEAFAAEKENLEKYNTYFAEAAQRLEEEMNQKDDGLENAYTATLGRVNKHPLHGLKEADIADKTNYNSYLKLVERSENSRNQLKYHRWMLREMAVLSKIPANEIQQNENAAEFSRQNIEAVFKLIKDKKNTSEITAAIEGKMIPFYHDLAVQNSANDEIDLKYIQK
jgi:hypothetical protein